MIVTYDHYNFIVQATGIKSVWLDGARPPPEFVFKNINEFNKLKTRTLRFLWLNCLSVKSRSFCRMCQLTLRRLSQSGVYDSLPERCYLSCHLENHHRCNDFQRNDTHHNDTWHNRLNCDGYINILLSFVFLLSVIMLNDIMLSVIMLCVSMLSVILLSVIVISAMSL